MSSKDVAAQISPGGFRKAKLSPRLPGRNIISADNLPPESQFAMKTLNVTVDGDQELPTDIQRSQIGVQVLVSLENNHKRDEKASKLATEIQTAAQQLLTKQYTAPAESCTYLLKCYVVLAAERSLLHKITLGLIGEPKQECLEWFLQSQEVGNSDIIKAGRVGVVGKGADKTAELCSQLVEKVGVAA